jgi:hypothetical protein
VYHCLQKCTDVLDPVPGVCTETCLAASAIKVEKKSDIPEEEDPLAVTSPATKGEEEVSYIQQTAYSMALGGPRWYQSYPVRFDGWKLAVLMEVFVNCLSASMTVLRCHLNKTMAFAETTSNASVTFHLTVLTAYNLRYQQLCKLYLREVNGKYFFPLSTQFHEQTVTVCSPSDAFGFVVEPF